MAARAVRVPFGRPRGLVPAGRVVTPFRRLVPAGEKRHARPAAARIDVDDVELGENLDIDGLVKTADVYARVAMEVCGVA